MNFEKLSKIKYQLCIGSLLVFGFIITVYFNISNIVKLTILYYLLTKSYKIISNKPKRIYIITLSKYLICMVYYMFFDQIMDILFAFLPLQSIYSLIKVIILVWMLWKEENMLLVYQYIQPKLKYMSQYFQKIKNICIEILTKLKNN